jgi:hypothetical protein
MLTPGRADIVLPLSSFFIKYLDKNAALCYNFLVYKGADEDSTCGSKKSQRIGVGESPVSFFARKITSEPQG